MVREVQRRDLVEQLLARAEHPAQLDALGVLELEAVLLVVQVDQGQTSGVRGHRLEAGGDRGQRGVVADEQVARRVGRG